MATNEEKIDILSKQSENLADFMTKLSKAVATGDFVTVKAGVLKLSDDLLDVKTLEPIANLLAEELGKDGGPNSDKLMLLSEQGEMLASLQKEYYVIHNRHDRIGRASRGISNINHSGGEHGVVLGRIKNAGGAYTNE